MPTPPRSPARRGGNRRWREFRALVISREQRRLGRTLLTCWYCKRDDLDPRQPPHTATSIELDHVVPVARGGDEFPGFDGVRIACHPCNRRRGAKADWSAEAKPPLRRGWHGTAGPVTRQWTSDDYWIDA